MIGSLRIILVVGKFCRLSSFSRLRCAAVLISIGLIALTETAEPARARSTLASEGEGERTPEIEIEGLAAEVEEVERARVGLELRWLTRRVSFSLRPLVAMASVFRGISNNGLEKERI